MSVQLDSDPDFEFFDSTALEAANTPRDLTNDFAAESTSQYVVSLVSVTQKSPLRNQRSLPSAESTASPASLFDSASESSDYQRKSSSGSSSSALTPGGDVMIMGDDTDMANWKHDHVSTTIDDSSAYVNPFADGCIDPSTMSTDLGFHDQLMREHKNEFDFGSSASSSPFGHGTMGGGYESPEMPIIKMDSPTNHQNQHYSPHPALSARRKTPQISAESSNHDIRSNSRDASPLSAMITSKESSPATFFHNSPSPGSGLDLVNGHRLGDGPPAPKCVSASDAFPNQGYPGIQSDSLQNSMLSASCRLFSNYANSFRPILTIHPTPLKSRVETQIPIKMTLFPLPAGVTKLHLPTHTISKPKLLTKPTPEKSPDTLELYTTLVCTSAMANPEIRRRAFARAAQASHPEIGPKKEEERPEGNILDEDDESRPANGGEVKICSGCIVRERKRAARKKAKKVEEEESWQKYEAQRVVVFNTHEIKEWQTPSDQPESEATGERAEPFVPEGALQVDAPMRIACYCRHQNEKLGFSVIFTIKDHLDRLVAQEMTSSIMITDDHKTSLVPTSFSTHTSVGSDGQPVAGPLSSGEPVELKMGRCFRLSHSSSDLQALQQRHASIEAHPSSTATSPHHHQRQQLPAAPSHPVSASLTPRVVSRQTSPSAPPGPSSKKRKANGSSTKVPSALTMTRLESGESSNAVPISNSSTSSLPSPFTPNFPTFPMVGDQPFQHTNVPHMPAQYTTHNGPPTPNSNGPLLSTSHRSHSMDNLAMARMYSTPGSGIPSRVSSPSGMQNSMDLYQHQQAQMAQAVANGLYGMPFGLNPHRPPTIHKLIPSEGPKAGGIEVTCLGSGFCQGLEVMFGDMKATTTTYWGETSLVCLLPPSAFAGNVPVTFKHQHHQHHSLQGYPTPIPKQQAFFKYVDDDELQILRTALSVLSHKMTGKMEDVRDLARRIVGDGSSAWGTTAPPAGAGGSNGGVQNNSGSGFRSASFGVDVDVEAVLLKCLDLMDLDDSPHLPRYNLRRASGQTMLHLACSLGLHRFVAALLARGANPEPRDRGGFTPMHFAALGHHPHIIRRLMLSGADPLVKNVQGYTAFDLSNSDDVDQALRHLGHDMRRRSAGSLRGRICSSATSLRSRESYATVPTRCPSPDRRSESECYEYADLAITHDDDCWVNVVESQSRQPSASSFSRHTLGEHEKDSVMNLPDLHATVRQEAPNAAISAFRDHISAQINQFQQSMQLNLPNLPQMPRFDMMPVFPGYQAYFPNPNPMVRRITNLVHRPGFPKEQDNRWWDLFSGHVSTSPPAYEDIFPNDDVDFKRESATQAVADNVADKECIKMFGKTETERVIDSSQIGMKRSLQIDTVRIGQKHTITREQQDHLRLAHAEKMKRISRDRNLFFVWIPLLLIILLAMFYKYLPTVHSSRISENIHGNLIEI